MQEIKVEKTITSTDVYNKLICKVDCSRGAPMGRPNVGDVQDVYAQKKQIYCKRVPLVHDSAYDKGGAYWGCGGPLYVKYTLDMSYVEFYRF